MDVFISYSRKDYQDENKQPLPHSVIQKIKDKLTEENISYWFDEDGIYVGDQFVNLIAKAIKEADVFVFVSSENSNKSPWTVSEVATAYHYKKKIIPVRLDDTEYDESIVMFLAALDHMDYFSNPRAELGRMVSSIKTYLLEKNVKSKKEQEEKARQQRLKVVDELMSQEYSNKLSVENEIVSQKDVLKQLEDKLKEIENYISELQEEKDKLNGATREIKPKEKKTWNTHLSNQLNKEWLSGIFKWRKSQITVCVVLVILILSMVCINQCSQLRKVKIEQERQQMVADSIFRADSIRYEIARADSIFRYTYMNENFLTVSKYERIGSQKIHLYLESALELDSIEIVSANIALEGCSHNMVTEKIEIIGKSIECDLSTTGHSRDCWNIDINELVLDSKKYGKRSFSSLGHYKSSNVIPRK